MVRGRKEARDWRNEESRAEGDRRGQGEFRGRFGVVRQWMHEAYLATVEAEEVQGER